MRASADALADLERRLGRLFVVSLTVSAMALAVGLAWYLVEPEASTSDRLLQAGLFALMATPILRVAVSTIAYVRMRDWFFALTTLAVLAELSISIMYASRQ
jgi:uncharacterized membrane protein